MNKKDLTYRQRKQYIDRAIHRLAFCMIMPFDKGLETLKKTISINAHYLQHIEIGIIIALDSPEETGLIKVITENHVINWEVIVNDVCVTPKILSLY